MSTMGVVRGQGMCPHEIYLGRSTFTCIKVLKLYTAYMYSRIKNFFGPKKNRAGGGSLGKGIWEPTPHLL